MATFNTVDELVQILDSDPQMLEALRSRLLTKELLELPQRFAEYAEASDLRFEAIDRRFEAIDRRFEALERGLDELREEVRKFVEATNLRFEEVNRNLNAIHDITRRQQTDFRNFRGQFAENTAIKKAPSITGAVGEAIGKRLLVDRILTIADLNAIMKQASSIADISQGDIISFQEADLIIQASEVLNGSDVCYISVEASYTCDESDTDRAVRHAELLREFTGRNVYPVVAGVRLNKRISALVNGGGDDSVLWHKLEEEELDA